MPYDEKFHKRPGKKLERTQIIDMVNAPQQSDEELYGSFLKTRDREILGTLFRKYMSLVFGVSMKYLREKHAAQDATMEVFERLLGYQPKSEIKNFRAYLYVMSKNYCLMKQRGDKVFTMEISDSDMELATEMHPIDESNGREALLERCMKDLKDMQLQCVSLFYMKRKSYMEISNELKMTLNAVKSHIQNGKRNLKLCIESKE